MREWEGSTVFGHVLKPLIFSNNEKFKLEYVKPFIEAGVSIYDECVQTWDELTDNPSTYLSIALKNWAQNQDKIPYMIEAQPFRDHSSVPIYDYISLACLYGCSFGLKAITESTEEALPVIRDNLYDLIHELLTRLESDLFNYVFELNECIDCLEFLLENGPIEGFAQAPEGRLSAKNRLLTMLQIPDETVPMTDEYGKARYLAYRIRFTEQDAKPVFLHHSALVLQKYMNLPLHEVPPMPS